MGIEPTWGVVKSLTLALALEHEVRSRRHVLLDVRPSALLHRSQLRLRHRTRTIASLQNLQKLL